MDNILKVLVFSFFAIVLMNCDKKEKQKEFSLNEPSMSYNDLKELALTKGDTIAYKEMSIAYMDSPNDDRFLYTALIMANKYNYHLAYEDVYYVLTDFYHKKEFTELEGLDKKTRKLALDFLKDGAKNGNIECQRIYNYYKNNDLLNED